MDYNGVFAVFPPILSQKKHQHKVGVFVLARPAGCVNKKLPAASFYA